STTAALPASTPTGTTTAPPWSATAASSCASASTMSAPTRAAEGDPMLAERIRDDLTAAMKRRDELATSALRMALAGIKEAAVSGKEARDLDDDEIVKVLTKQVKKREEAAEAFRNAGRADRADRELAEAEVLAPYLPAALTPDELEAII